MAAIDVGGWTGEPFALSQSNWSTLTIYNTANATGTLDTFYVFVATQNATASKVGTIYSTGGTNNTCRDWESLGTISKDSKQTFTGKNCDVTAGDGLCCYITTGEIAGINGSQEMRSAGGASDFVTDKASHSWGGLQNYRACLEAAGNTPAMAPTVTTEAASSVVSGSCTGNGTITAEGSASPSRRGFAYKSGTSGDPTTADSVSYDDGTFGTGAYTKTIAPLKLGTHYRVAAYATNSVGTAYGSTVDVFTRLQTIY